VNDLAKQTNSLKVACSLEFDDIWLEDPTPSEESQRDEEFMSTIHNETTAPADELILIDEVSEIAPKQTTEVANEFDEPSQMDALILDSRN
jgi:zona occludens toxin (predicted ATPase)